VSFYSLSKRDEMSCLLRFHRNFVLRSSFSTKGTQRITVNKFSSTPTHESDILSSYVSKIPRTPRARNTGTPGASSTFGASSTLGASKSSTVSKPYLFGGLFFSLLFGVGYTINKNPESKLRKIYNDSPIQTAFSWLYSKTYGKYEEIYDPVSTKLLPSWPDDPVYGGVDPDTPCPPCLIIKVENTLVAPIYDQKEGWKYARRPGAVAFIEAMSKQYEVVLVCETDIDETVLQGLDPGENGMPKTHRLGPSHLEHRADGKYIKRLDYMNRDMSKLILIDDDPEIADLYPNNVLLVSKFDEKAAYEARDTILSDLSPLLQSLVHHSSEDFREALEDLGTDSAEEAVVEYRMRISRAIADEKAKRSGKGLGKLIRTKLDQGSSTDELVESSETKSSILRAGSGRRWSQWAGYGHFRPEKYSDCAQDCKEKRGLVPVC